MKWSDIGDLVKTWHVMLLLVILFCGGTFKLVTAIYAFDQKKADLVLVMNQADQMKVGFASIMRDTIQKRIWIIEDQYGTDCMKMPLNIRNQYRDLQDQLRKKDEEIKMINSKQKK